MNDNELGARLKAAREHLGLNIAAMAQRIGMSHRGYQDNEYGRTIPKSTLLAKFVELGFSANWLLTGQGPMQIDDPSGSQQKREQLMINRVFGDVDNQEDNQADQDKMEAEAKKHLEIGLYLKNALKPYLADQAAKLWEAVLYDLLRSHKVSKSDIDSLLTAIAGEKNEFDEEYALVPGYHVQVSTGNGRSHPFADEGIKRRLAFRRKYLNYRQVNSERLAVVFSKGDSMEPTIKDNDSLLINLDSTTPKDGKIFVVRLGDDLYAKRIQRLVDGGIVLISDNKEYQPQTITNDQLDQLHVVGQVIWIGKDV